MYKIPHGSFDIIAENDGRFYVSPATGFNPKGYATVSGAKGAITKQANGPKKVGTPAPVEESSDDKEHASAPCPDERLLASPDDKENADVGGMVFGEGNDIVPFKGEVTPFGVVPDQASENRIEGMTQAMAAGDKVGFTWARTPNGDPIHGDPKMAHMYAEMDYFGMSKRHDKRSRAKREGVNPNRKHGDRTPATRKALKAWKMA